MNSLLLALATLVLTAACSAAIYKSFRLSSAVAVAGVFAACVLALKPAIAIFLHGGQVSFQMAWSIPYGALNLGIDSLSAFFLILILGFAPLAAVYGYGYLSKQGSKKNPGATWFFFNLLIAGMMLVVTARNGLLFLMAWELMTLSSFFLVTFNHEKKQVRQAGWTYLIASHAGTAALFVLFFLFGNRSGSLNFDQFSGALSLSPHLADTIFILAIIGFGVKAGFIPLHVWLPEAHPAAPSHVSALMSGIMIKTGIYGLLRIAMLTGHPPIWWGWALIGIGLSSGILGVLFALAQHEIKPLLAYHSVENIGIITMGLGLGYLGLAYGLPEIAVLGFTGGILHVLNHAIFKSLLFFGAGNILHSAHTGSLDHLGGLLKRMPWTGFSFLIGAMAISGLPPFNGFISEFLIYLGSLRVIVSNPSGILILTVCIIGGLALIGGLASACFVKVFGIAFLGEPRTHEAANAKESQLSMRTVPLILAVLCFAIGMTAPWLLSIFTHLLCDLTGLPQPIIQSTLSRTANPLGAITAAGCLFLLFIALLAALRYKLISGRRTVRTVTWDCGYAKPNPKMQYTASSFPNLINEMVRPLIWLRTKYSPPAGFFPNEAHLETEPVDTFREGLFRNLFEGFGWILSRLRWMQQGRVQLYVLYIALTLLVLLLWSLR